VRTDALVREDMKNQQQKKRNADSDWEPPKIRNRWGRFRCKLSKSQCWKFKMIHSCGPNFHAGSSHISTHPSFIHPDHLLFLEKVKLFHAVTSLSLLAFLFWKNTFLYHHHLSLGNVNKWYIPDIT
jgi:hypothetical protein